MVDSVNLHCNVGQIDINNVMFGVMSTEVKDPFFCREDAIWGTGKDPLQYTKKSSTNTKGIHDCSS